MHLSLKPSILLTSATGYVGGRLLPRLLGAGYQTRCAARQPESLSHISNPNAEIVQADLFDYASLEDAFDGVKVAYYLVHSLGSSANFEEKEIACAENFVRAAEN